MPQRAWAAATTVRGAEGPDFASKVNGPHGNTMYFPDARNQPLDGVPALTVNDEDVSAPVISARRSDQMPQILGAAPPGQLLDYCMALLSVDVDVDDAHALADSAHDGRD